MAVAYVMLLILLSIPSLTRSDCYKSIISFGDSLSDTGNLLHLSTGDTDLPPSARRPYGRTFFHQPTGRYSDGRLMIDFIAKSLGLPFVPPYITGKNVAADGGSFATGVNFAVGGAKALDNEFYEKRGLYGPVTTNASLGVQLDWFRQFLATIPDGRGFLKSSLVLVGEIGGNDYNHPLMQGLQNISFEMVQSFVPAVVNFIGSIIEELIKLGVETMIVPGNFPIGCLPAYLTIFKNSSTKDDYDPKTGCLNWLNEFSRYHNKLLLKELSRIRELHPHVSIIYGDYYNAAMRLYFSPQRFGFTKGVFVACCGAGGPYNYNESAFCGIPPSKSCDDPHVFANWDGMHFTEAFYRLVVEGLLEGPYSKPQFNTICPSISNPSRYYSEY